MLAEEIRRDWAQIVGEEVARHSHPVELKQGVLAIAADSSAWLCELTLRSEALTTAIRARCREAVVSVRVVLGKAPPARTSATPSSRPSAMPLSAEDEQSVEALTASVADPALAATLRRLVRKDLIAQRRRRAPSSARKENP